MWHQRGKNPVRGGCNFPRSMRQSILIHRIPWHRSKTWRTKPVQLTQTDVNRSETILQKRFLHKVLFLIAWRSCFCCDHIVLSQKDFMQCSKQNKKNTNASKWCQLQGRELYFQLCNYPNKHQCKHLLSTFKLKSTQIDCQHTVEPRVRHSGVKSTLHVNTVVKCNKNKHDTLTTQECEEEN